MTRQSKAGARALWPAAALPAALLLAWVLADGGRGGGETGQFVRNRPADFQPPPHLLLRWPQHLTHAVVSADDDGRNNGAVLAGYAWEPVGGAAEASALVFLHHGYGDHSDALAFVAKELAAAGFLVYAVDTPGHGRSSGKRGYVDDLNATAAACISFARSQMEKHPHLTDAFVFGESMGGLISLLMLHAEPGLFDGGVVLAPAVEVDENLYPILRKLAHVVDAVWPDLEIGSSIADENGPEGLTNDLNVFYHYDDDPMTYRGKMAARTGVSFLDAFEHLQSHVVHHLSSPLLFMHGEHDSVVKSDSTRKFFDELPSEDKTYLLLKGEAHTFCKDQNWKKHVHTARDWLLARAQKTKQA